MLPLLALLFGALLLGGYHLYGRWVERRIDPDAAHVTPAHEHADGVDYVPTAPFYLFGQHLSAIAAAGPIAGPILACRDFGWLPCLIWIGLGVVLIGAVHDYSSLAASVRHGAASIAEIAREELGKPAGRAMMAFIFIALVYVIVAFADITAATFVTGPEELRGAPVDFHPGGAVAIASTLYLALAVVMGLVQRFLRPPLWLMTLLFVPATFGLAWLGTEISHVLVLERTTWAIVILVYCVVAAVTPVWMLLQPRGYLGGFVLFGALLVGLLGIFLGGHEVQQPMFKAWEADKPLGNLFPFLFVTIACGACSGFHGLVCSGTTSKQIDRETHMRFVGYGGMLAEALLAFIALSTIMIATDDEIAGLGPGAIYGNGLGRFMTLFLGEERLPIAITFGAMAFSTFVFDTLDVCTRLGRYLAQELFGWTGRLGAVAGTLLTIVPPALVLSFSGKGAYMEYWALFGASNQMLAALTLFAIGMWMKRRGRSGAFAFWPMAFVLGMTSWALIQILVLNLGRFTGSLPAAANAVAAGLLLLLAVFLIRAGLVRARQTVPLP